MWEKRGIYGPVNKEVRLGGWGTEGPRAPTLGRHLSACATILRLRVLSCYLIILIPTSPPFPACRGGLKSVIG